MCRSQQKHTRWNGRRAYRSSSRNNLNPAYRPSSKAAGWWGGGGGRTRWEVHLLSDAKRVVRDDDDRKRSPFQTHSPYTYVRERFRSSFVYLSFYFVSFLLFSFLVLCFPYISDSGDKAFILIFILLILFSICFLKGFRTCLGLGFVVVWWLNDFMVKFCFGRVC